jgi:hypothetical protein
MVVPRPSRALRELRTHVAVYLERTRGLSTASRLQRTQGWGTLSWDGASKTKPKDGPPARTDLNSSRRCLLYICDRSSMT